MPAKAGAQDQRTYHVASPAHIEAVFAKHSKSGPCPDRSMLTSLATYMNDELFPFDRAAHEKLVLMSKGMPALPNDQKILSDSLSAIVEHLPLFIREWEARTRWEIASRLADDSGRGLYPPDYPEELTKRACALLSATNAMIEFMPKMLAPVRRVRSSDWHGPATVMAEMIVGAFRLSGRTRVGLGQPTSPAVIILVWALGRIGYGEVERSAICKMFKRQAASKRDNLKI